MRGKSELLLELREHPDVVLLMQEVQEILSRESEKRKEFRKLVHENVKAEFINGEIVYHSPVRRRHWKSVGNLYAKLHLYVETHGLGEPGSEKVMVSLSRNDYEPDIVFFSKEKAGNFSDEQLLFPAPDFIVEVLSDSTEKFDRNEKFVDYAAHGVSEYWIVNAENHTIEQYINKDNKYELFQKLHKGTIESSIIQGFSIDLAEVFK